ncbi:hypothetical protein ACVRY7_10125 [Streptococcus ictaluri]|uniref:hypothetical protein n=1 Tax=Streptococcus ictaluri TaxID=380397 RepID=UPI001F314609|nr:hypothetical protein [Streptococcus ictaluri]
MPLLLCGVATVSANESLVTSTQEAPIIAIRNEDWSFQIPQVMNDEGFDFPLFVERGRFPLFQKRLTMLRSQLRTWTETAKTFFKA